MALKATSGVCLDPLNGCIGYLTECFISHRLTQRSMGSVGVNYFLQRAAAMCYYMYNHVLLHVHVHVPHGESRTP